MPSHLLSRPVLLLLLLFCSGCHVHLNQQATPAAARFEIDQVQRDIVYTEFGWPQALQADLYLPRTRGPKPVVLMIHGGGWANRSRDDMNDISEALTQRGYAVLKLNYRFAPKYQYPAQLLDMQQALAWVTANAALFDFDLKRVNAWGYSSGAHLAALLGGFDEQRLPEEANRGLPRLNAVVAGGIPADLTRYDDSPLVKRFLGGELDAIPERYAEASPLHHVSADDPAVFLYHGKFDALVSQDQSQDYYDALRAAGVDTELYVHNWRGHMTMFLFGGDAERRAIDFLDRNNQAQALVATE
jgi:acetyl esterase/lipase